MTGSAASTPSRCALHLAAFKAIAAAVEQLEIDDTQDEIDRTAFLDDIRITILRFERERPHVHDPGFWLSHLFEALYILLRRRRGDPAASGPGAVERLKATPAFLASARETLKDPPRVFLDTATAMTDGGLALMSQAAAAGHANGYRTSQEQSRRRRPRRNPRWDGSALALRQELNANPDDLSFAIGEEQFNRRLHHEHALPAGAPELYRYGLHLVEEVEAEVAALARRDRSLRSLAHPGRAAAAPSRRRGRIWSRYFRAEVERASRFVAERQSGANPRG